MEVYKQTLTKHYKHYSNNLTVGRQSVSSAVDITVWFQNFNIIPGWGCIVKSYDE